MPTRNVESALVFSTADQLQLDLADVSPEEWIACDVERWRSAASRSYYAVYLHLKIALLDSGFLKYPFPKEGSHRKIYNAVKEALKPSHYITQKLLSLRIEREFADYEVVMEVDQNYAQDRLDEAYAALGKIDDLKKPQLQAIADKLEGR